MRNLLTTIFLVFVLQTNAQFLDYKNHFQGKYSFGTIGGTNYQAYSLTFEFNTKKKIGLLYNLDFINRPDNIKQVHAGVGNLLGPPIFGLGLLAATTNDTIKNSDLDLGSGGILLGILMFILPDGLSYNIPISYKITFSPYVNFLGVDYIRDRNVSRNYFKYGMSIGTKLNISTNKGMTFNPFIEARGVAGYGWSIGGGLGIGILFNKRKDI